MMLSGRRCQPLTQVLRALGVREDVTRRGDDLYDRLFIDNGRPG